jgi:hypothetical protein
VAELRGAGDGPDDGDASARRFTADTGDGAGETRPLHEPSPRAEYADVVRQNVAEANAAPADVSPGGPDQADTAQESTDQADAPPENASPEGMDPEGVDPRAGDQPETDQGNAGQADTDHGDTHQADSGQVGLGQAESDRSTEGSITDALERFDPRRAGLPEVSRTEAAAYIEEHLADRPWLAPARDCSPEVQRVIAALDQGHGHAHIRHEGWVTEERNERRVQYLEDPAQLDPEKRDAGIDGLKNGSQSHRCSDIATRITDPEAFAAAFARGVEHPDIRAALDSPGPVPRPVELPISEVLGKDGHKFCSGWQLEPVNGSMLDAVANREAWLAGNRDAMEPRIRPVGTFEGGTVTYVFRPGAVGGHEIITMYVNPPDENPCSKE